MSTPFELPFAAMPPRSFSLNSTHRPLLKLPTSPRLPQSQCRRRTSRRFYGGRLQIPGSVVQQRQHRFQESPMCTAFDEVICVSLETEPEILITHSESISVVKALLGLSMKEGAVDIPSLDDWGGLEGSGSYAYSSSDDEDSDGDGDFIINPVNDVDLPGVSRVSNNDALTVTAHRFAMLGRRRKKRRSKYGALLNMGLITFLTGLLLLIDCCAWRIVRLPLESFFLTHPFFISMVLVSCAGYVCVPLLDVVCVDQIVQTEWSTSHSLKKRTPTMGGLFFVPIGVFVALFKVRFSSTEVMGAAMATLVYATIGFLDDSLSLSKNRYYGLSSRVKLIIEVAVGTIFSLWLECINISSPYGMYTFLKALVPLPAPLGLICLGKLYTMLSSFGFVSMTNGVSSTDGLDGLAGGTAALSFTAMSIAVLPICPDLAIFGASMAGACVGFLLHNRYRASVFMGDTGSLALGGALASMAACTGMFFPLLISSGVFLVENLSVILQVTYFKVTKKVLKGAGRRLLRMAPFHSHLELCGFKEPIIVAGAYVVSAVLSLLAAYVGLTSA